MTDSDLPLVHRWLAMPHVAEWWGNPDEQFALVREDLEQPDMDQFIVSIADHPFAYLQCYDPTAWPEGGLGAHPRGSRGVDQFIGDPVMIERSHGSAFIRAFVDGLFLTGTPRVLTDPDPRNARAIRAYEKAGFRQDREVTTPDGPALLMVRNR
jgi:aminoglycoside 6'-N-acetyltransferase